MTLTLPAKPATALLVSNRDSVRRVSGFVLTGNGELTISGAIWMSAADIQPEPESE